MNSPETAPEPKAPEAEVTPDSAPSLDGGVTTSPDLIDSVRRALTAPVKAVTDTVKAAADTVLTPESMSTLSYITSGLSWISSSFREIFKDMFGEEEVETAAYQISRPQNNDIPQSVKLSSDSEPTTQANDRRGDNRFALLGMFSDQEEDRDYAKRRKAFADILAELGEAERLEEVEELKKHDMAELLALQRDAEKITNPAQLAAKLKEISARVQDYGADGGSAMATEAAALEAAQNILHRWNQLEAKLAAAGFTTDTQIAQPGSTPQSSDDPAVLDGSGTGLRASTPPGTQAPPESLVQSDTRQADPQSLHNRFKAIGELMDRLEDRAEELLAQQASA